MFPNTPNLTNPMRFLTISAACLFAAAATAQTYTIQGKVEDVQGTQNQFFLDGTLIPVFSTALNLNLWQGQQALLDVVDVGTAGAPLLRIDAATPTTKVMDMGNLRLNRTSTFEVSAPAGTAAFLFLDFTNNTGFTPIPGAGGVWLLGLSPHLLAGGFTNAVGVFETTFATPNVPALVGLGVSGQTLTSTGGAWGFSNVDSREIEQ